MSEQVRDYRQENTTYMTNCVCGLQITWVAPFNMMLDDLEELVLEKFKWTLFPSRCPDCTGIVTTYED